MQEISSMVVQNQGVALATAEFIKEIVKTSVKTFIEPKLEKWYKGAEVEKNLEEIESNIEEYIERSYKNIMIMNTIVFKNEQKTVDDLYIPLTIVKSNPLHRNKNEKICINKYDDVLMSKYKKILLVDSAGMGKSTIIKYLYLNVVRQNKGIPILIELRKLNNDTQIIDFILNEMNGIRPYLKRENIFRLIEEGDFIFFFDGYDEIIQESKEEITRNLQEFISKTMNNKFIISSRDENELSCFGDFQRFDIKSLNKVEAYELIKKYDNYGEMSKELIEKLETEENLKMINEFLENPLMVSLLYKAFEYKKTIPYKKHIFYKQVYNALFEEHDLSKIGAYKRKKRSNLDIDDFHCILRTIGFITLTKGISYSRESFIKIVQKAKEKNRGIEFAENKFIEDVINSVPIFIKEGIEYRWSHKSFQEYFAANYIYTDCKDQQADILRKMICKENIKKYYNVLDLYYDMDYKGFRRNVIYSTINKLINCYKKTYIDKNYKSYDCNFVKLRKLAQFNFISVQIFMLNKNEKKDEFGSILNRINGLFDEVTIVHSRVNIAIIFKKDFSDTLLKLLNNKNSKLVKKIKKQSDTEELNMIAKILDDGKLHNIDDKINNPVNKIEVFNIFTKFMFHGTTSEINKEFLMFDLDKCINEKKQIEEEIEEEKDDIDFI